MSPKPALFPWNLVFRACGFFIFRQAAISCLLLIGIATNISYAQVRVRSDPSPGFENRIRGYIDTLRIIDNHEHLDDPDIIKNTNFCDFTLLFLHYGYPDLVSAGLPRSLFNNLFNEPLPPREKWKLIEPYWEKSFNTSFLRLACLSAKELYDVDDINELTVDTLSQRIARAYRGSWPKHVIKDLCRIDYILQDGEDQITGLDNILYTKRFSSWLNVRSKFAIDSLAIMRVDPIYSLEDFVTSLEEEFKAAVNSGIVAVKINIAYNRSLKIDNVETDAARKVFRTLVNGNEDKIISKEEARPLQDYMFHRLMEMVDKTSLPVAIHTGFQAGNGNYIMNSNPALLSNIFISYPDINFVLFHGSYPFGGELSTLAKNFRNVYIDLNWVYAISPSYTERYLHDWIETVPVGKIMAFGGDFRNIENIYAELLTAKQIIANVLISKVKEGYFSEKEAFTVAKMILSDNARRFYNLK